MRTHSHSRAFTHALVYTLTYIILYTVSVVAVSGDKRSEDLEETFYTRSSKYLFFAYIGSRDTDAHPEQKNTSNIQNVISHMTVVYTKRLLLHTSV